MTNSNKAHLQTTLELARMSTPLSKEQQVKCLSVSKDSEALEGNKRKAARLLKLHFNYLDHAVETLELM